MELTEIYARHTSGNIGKVTDWDQRKGQSLVKFAGKDAEWIDDNELTDIHPSVISATTIAAIG